MPQLLAQQMNKLGPKHSDRLLLIHPVMFCGFQKKNDIHAIFTVWLMGVQNWFSTRNSLESHVDRRYHSQMFHAMKEPIQFRCPGPTIGLKELVLKVGESLLIILFDGQRLTEVAYVVH